MGEDERSSGMHKRVLIGGAAAVAALVLVGGGVAVAGMADDEEASVTGPEADAATKAALEATGGGTANAVERDSEDGATWEVEVTRRDGTTVDVRLDENYAVVVIEGDSEDAD
jgi:Peptidase propeptide and YPEB domain